MQNCCSGQGDTKAPSFEKHAKEVLHEVRGALANLVADVSADPENSQDMARRFGINKNLTWKISKIICESDLCATVQHLPGKSGLNIFIKALADAGAGESVLQRVDASIEQFDNLVSIHSADRETLVLMLSNLSEECQQQQNEGHRRLAFRGNSAIWGVQTKVHFSSQFIAPSENPDLMDMAVMFGLINFRRLRDNVPWVIASFRRVFDDGSNCLGAKIKPIDPSYASKDGVPIIGEFSEGQLDDLRVGENADGAITLELNDGPIGSTGAATYVTGWYGRGMGNCYAEVNNTRGGHSITLSTPAEMLVHDLFVHRDLGFAMSPQVGLYNLLPACPEHSYDRSDRGLLPMCEGLYEIGDSPADVDVPEIPRYPEMVKMVFDRVGWKADQFQGFRFKMLYPPIPSMASIRYDLDER